MSIDKVKLKALAEGMKGWDKMTECWPCDENGPDWQVGRLDEDDNRWPLLTIDTEQYDQEQDAPKVAQYYAAANPAAVLALLAEADSQTKTIESIDKHLRGNVNDPDPLPSIMPGAFSVTTTYGLVAGIRRERDKLKAENEALRQFILGFAEYDDEMAYAFAAMSKEGK
jgi:hypothetical protein